MSEPGASGAGPPEESGRKAFLLRLPAGVHEDLRAWAAAELRSLNGHIEYLLRDALRRRGRPVEAPAPDAEGDSGG